MERKQKLPVSGSPTLEISSILYKGIKWHKKTEW